MRSYCQMIELHHPLALLASRMPWQEIEALIAQCSAHQVRRGTKIEDVDLFGDVCALVGGGVSNAGRPRLPLRVMVSLLYLNHASNESDEGVVERWAETSTWQYFSGQEYFEHRWPSPRVTIVVAPIEPRIRGRRRRKEVGTIRTNIQEPGGCSVVAA